MWSNWNFCIAGGDAEWCGHYENILVVPYKVKHSPTWDPVIPILGARKLLFIQKHAHSCLQQLYRWWPNTGRTQVSFNKGMGKPTIWGNAPQLKKKKMIELLINLAMWRKWEGIMLMKDATPVSIHTTFSERWHYSNGKQSSGGWEMGGGRAITKAQQERAFWVVGLLWIPTVGVISPCVKPMC